MKNELLLIKLGGSLITNKSRPLTPRLRTIRRLGQEIRSALSIKKNIKIILSHGSGSFGHVPAKNMGPPTDSTISLAVLGPALPTILQPN